MAAIPQPTRNSITLRLLDHAERHRPQLTRVQVTYRGAFSSGTQYSKMVRPPSRRTHPAKPERVLVLRDAGP
jgi:hypothetical protein